MKKQNKKTMQQTKENNKHQLRGGETDNLTEKQKTVRQKKLKKRIFKVNRINMWRSQPRRSDQI